MFRNELCGRASGVLIVAHLLGILMVLIVTSCFVLRLIVRESDPKSLLMVLYVRSFQLLNQFVVWQKLPTCQAVINLGALREVLRARAACGVLLRSSSAIATNARMTGSTSKPTMGNASLNPDDQLFTKSNPGARFGRNIQ
jgi:hypothetical protein